MLNNIWVIIAVLFDGIFVLGLGGWLVYKYGWKGLPVLELGIAGWAFAVATCKDYKPLVDIGMGWSAVLFAVMLFVLMNVAYAKFVLDNGDYKD